MDVVTLALALKKGKAYTDNAKESAINTSESYTDAKIDALPKGFVYKGTVPTFNDLPITENNKGDTITTNDDGKEYVWTIDAPSGDRSNWLEIGAVLANEVVEVGAVGQTEPSTTLKVGGLFFERG